MKLSIGFSPCPNDCFIFDALVNKKIDTGDFEFEPVLEDVETLNEWALEGRLQITKLSFPAFFQAMEHYVLLKSGSALGKGVGPLLVAKNEDTDFENRINFATIALPGLHTTANLLFSFAFPEATNKKFMLFSEIEDAVSREEASFGVIIHENRFTYARKGLKKIMDLGEYWERKMNAPIPLGGIAVHQSLRRSVAVRVEQLIRQSLDYAFTLYPMIPEYVKQHSQAMEEEVMRQHIDLYVNNYSLDLGEEGRQAIAILHQTFLQMNKQAAETEENTLFL
ncbi:MAG TPA: 1,4-dihydroxy-6-naphthoate synthase [Chitinophagaceae bacterium]|nr:1,4-dihydroxy-6-naphthoate synthase [Chitinophagaceae bacterium]